MTALRRWVTTIAALAAFLAAVGPAQAGTYTVHTCQAPDGGSLGIPWTIESRHGAFVTGNGCPSGYFWLDLTRSVQHANDEYATTRFVAPAGTEITGYSLWRSVQLSTPYRYDFFEMPAQGGIAIKESCFADSGCGGRGDFTTGVAPENLIQASDLTGVGGLAFNLYCPNVFGSGAPCPAAAPAANFQLHRAEITISDAHPPELVAPPAGPLLSSSVPLTGEQQVFVGATDEGGGVHEVVFEVDGGVAGRATIDDNGGRCRPPFSAAQPCKSEVRGTVGLDTASLGDGEHSLRLLVTDATGTNSVAWGPIKITTANHPCNLTPRSKAFRVRASFAGRRKRARLAGFGQRLVVRGQVTLPDGTPAAAVPVCVAARNAAPGSRLRRARTLITDAEGRFADKLRRGPSRRVHFVVRAPDGAASASVAVRVRASVRLQTERRRLLNGQVLTLRGSLRGRPIPRQGVRVELQVREGAGWQTFTATTANQKGRFRFAYRFTRTTGLRRYVFRALVPEQAAYPYAVGHSASRAVIVRG